MIDLRRLRVLRAVAHYGTITAAAEALHFTTSAASQQIRQLGRDLGVVLLEPQGRRVRLTPAARRLLAHADAIETRWEQAEIDLRAGGDEPAGVLRLCGIPTAIAALLAPIVRPLRDRYPRLTVRIQEAEQDKGFNLLFDGEADLAVVDATSSNPPLSDPRFEQHPLVDDIFDLAVAADHPLASRESVTLAETAGEDWILQELSCTCREHTLSACGTAGFTPNVVHNALDWHAIANLVAHGLGVALVPRLAYLPTHLPVARVPLAGHPTPSRKLLTCTAPAAATTRRSPRPSPSCPPSPNCPRWPRPDLGCFAVVPPALPARSFHGNAPTAGFAPATPYERDFRAVGPERMGLSSETTRSAPRRMPPRKSRSCAWRAERGRASIDETPRSSSAVCFLGAGVSLFPN